MFTNVLWFELLEITIFISTSRLHGRTVKMQRVGRDRHNCGLAVGSMENNLFACHTSIIVIIFQINSEFKYKFIHVPNLEEPNGEFLYPPFFWRVPFPPVLVSICFFSGPLQLSLNQHVRVGMPPSPDPQLGAGAAAGRKGLEEEEPRPIFTTIRSTGGGKFCLQNFRGKQWVNPTVPYSKFDSLSSRSVCYPLPFREYTDPIFAGAAGSLQSIEGQQNDEAGQHGPHLLTS